MSFRKLKTLQASETENRVARTQTGVLVMFRILLNIHEFRILRFFKPNSQAHPLFRGSTVVFVPITVVLPPRPSQYRGNTVTSVPIAATTEVKCEALSPLPRNYRGITVVLPLSPLQCSSLSQTEPAYILDPSPNPRSRIWPVAIQPFVALVGRLMVWGTKHLSKHF